jgi:Fe-S cluster biosynthesis and repair protein YggX
LKFLMRPGWAKKVEIFDGSGVGKKSWNFWLVRGGMIIIKNNISTASANVWRQINSQKPFSV